MALQGKKQRMSDHSRRHVKPTSEEVYQDAKRILEEYLKRKLSEHAEHGDTEHSKNKKHYARSESYKNASRENVIDNTTECDDQPVHLPPERSRTMPSSYKIEKTRNGHGDVPCKKNKKVSGYSTDETDAEPSDDEISHGHKRKKKSFFQRAKDRLLHAIHRDSRSEDEDVDIYEDKSQKKKRTKKKSKKFESFHDSPDMNSGNRHIRETHAHIDQHISVGEDVERKRGLKVPGDNSSSLQDSHSSSSRRNSAGKKLLDSIRKSFKSKNKRKDISESKSAEPIGQSDREHSYSRSNSTPDRNGHLDKNTLDIPGSRSHQDRHSDRSQSSRSRSSSKSKADVVVTQSVDNSDPRTIRVHGLHLPDPEFLAASRPPHFVGGIESSVDIERTELTLADDGLWERSIRTHTRETTTFLPQSSLEMDGKSDELIYADEVDSPIDSQADKEETIDRIVKKLIEIGDNLSSEGELRQSQEAEGAVGGASSRDDRLTSLEREIINCLRQSGDDASSTIDNHASEFINGAVRETVYEKFSSTLRQSVGDDVNWNQMALVFHATKSALKVAGAGSKMATQIKDLTLKYVTEKCASWIVDQGGWESIVSDTDSELD